MGLTDKLVTWSRVKSPWIIHFNSGACNSCDIEVLAALIPNFDVERFGILLKGTPRHADVLVATGCVTRGFSTVRSDNRSSKAAVPEMTSFPYPLRLSCPTSCGCLQPMINMCGLTHGLPRIQSGQSRFPIM